MPGYEEPSDLHEAARNVGARQQEIHEIEQDLAEIEKEYEDSIEDAARQDAYADKYEGQSRGKSARRDAAAKRRGAERRKRLALGRLSRRAKFAAAGLAAAIVLLTAYAARGNPSDPEPAADGVEVGASGGNARADGVGSPVDAQDTQTQSSDDATTGDDRTGITVAVMDVFGPEGLRVVPAPGVVVRVEDDDGSTIAEATTTDDPAGVFLSVGPGSYRVRLDIGNYVPALPPSCDEGYVVDVTVTSGKSLELRARVYTTNVADNGESAGTPEGDCVTVVDPAAGD